MLIDILTLIHTIVGIPIFVWLFISIWSGLGILWEWFYNDYLIETNLIMSCIAGQLIGWPFVILHYTYMA